MVCVVCLRKGKYVISLEHESGKVSACFLWVSATHTVLFCFFFQEGGRKYIERLNLEGKMTFLPRGLVRLGAQVAILVARPW